MISASRIGFGVTRAAAAGASGGKSGCSSSYARIIRRMGSGIVELECRSQPFTTSSRLLSAARHVYQHEHNSLGRPHKLFLTLGSTLASFYNPARGDMIALLGELSGEPMLPKLRQMMSSSHEGRSLLLERPIINTKSVDMAYLEKLDDSMFGKQYWRWLKWCNVGPDTRAKVKFIEDPELAYVMQRYRECHDFFHLMCSMPVSHLGETVVKIFEASHMGLPVAFLSSIAGPFRLDKEERTALFGQGQLANWAWRMGKRSKPLIAVRWEDAWERNFEEMRRDLGFDEPPPINVEYAGRSKPKGQDKSRGRWPSKMIAISAVE